MMRTVRRQKITFAEMRAAGVHGLLIYCADYRCSHWTAISGDRWPDEVRLSDIESRFTCQAPARRSFFKVLEPRYPPIGSLARVSLHEGGRMKRALARLIRQKAPEWLASVV